MSLMDHKLTDERVNSLGVVSAPDTMTGTAEENKAVFDRLVREYVKACVNGLVEALMAPEAASELGFEATEDLEASNLQAAAEQLQTMIRGLDAKKIDKVDDVLAGNLAAFDGAGNLLDSGYAKEDLDAAAKSAKDAAKAAEESAKQAEEWTDPDGMLQGKMDKKTGYYGRIPYFLSDGNLGSSGRTYEEVFAILDEAMRGAGINLASGDNVDDLSEAGPYFCGNTVVKSGLLDGDLPYDGSFYLFHLRFNEDGSRKTQFAFRNTSVSVQMKVRNGNQGTWSAWEAVAFTKTFTVAVSTGWTARTGGGYQKTVAVSGITANDEPICDVVLGTNITTNSAAKTAWALVDRVVTAKNAVILYCDEGAPQTAFTMKLKVVR